MTTTRKPASIFAPQRLRALRERRDVTRDALAELVGCTRQTIRNWEDGLTLPGSDHLMKVADALHVSIGELLDYR